MLKRPIFMAVLVVFVLGFSFLSFGEEASETLVTDDYSNQKIPPEKYFEKWLDEYVKWIILSDEEDTFEDLKTVEEKMKFIEIFWLKRDPYPETLLNEYKEMYYERLDYIYATFGFSDTPGILSHRGMIYAVLGAPSFVDKNFTFSTRDSRMLRSGEIFSRRGLIWVYGDQPGLKIPAYYQVIFMRFSRNNYEIVLDAYANQSPLDTMIDRGAVGAKGFLPHRLLSLLKTKRLWLVKSNSESAKALMEKESIGNIENKTMTCEFSLVNSKEVWGQIECKINYPDLIFRVENDHSILKLEGVAALVDPALEDKVLFRFPAVNLKLTDQELLKMYESTLDITLTIPEEPKKVSKNITFVCELKDNISGVVYKAKAVSKK